MPKTTPSDAAAPDPIDVAEDLPSAPEPLASDIALREHQLVALRAALTLPAARDWFDPEGRLL